MSLKAYGVLRYIQDNPDEISADALARKFKEERKYFLRALKELREAGFITTVKAQINGSWTTYSRLVEPAPESHYGSSYWVLQSPLSQQNSNNGVILIHTETVTSSSTGSMREDNTMGYEFFDKTSSIDSEEHFQEAHKARVRKQEEWKAAKQEAKSLKKELHRGNRAKSQWSCKDVAYEFSDRTQDIWSIPPWSVNKSRFVQALGNMRKLHDTDGEIECEAIDRFFNSISVDKYNSGEHLWKLFITRFPGLVDEIKNVVREDEEVSEESLLRTAKALSILED